MNHFFQQIFSSVLCGNLETQLNATGINIPYAHKGAHALARRVWHKLVDEQNLTNKDFKKILSRLINCFQRQTEGYKNNKTNIRFEFPKISYAVFDNHKQTSKTRNSLKFKLFSCGLATTFSKVIYNCFLFEFYIGDNRFRIQRFVIWKK